jgi:hypothetical protein
VKKFASDRPFKIQAHLDTEEHAQEAKTNSDTRNFNEEEEPKTDIADIRTSGETGNINDQLSLTKKFLETLKETPEVEGTK